jgi:predicted nucleic acid-binding protein
LTRPVFLDTGAFVAMRRDDERQHGRALATIASLVTERARLVTTNYVFAETYAALLVRVGRHAAIEFGREFRSGKTFDLIRVDEELEESAWAILESHDDKLWSYVDATSFALMEREGITTAFAFDQHFAQRGLDVLPAPD